MQYSTSVNYNIIQVPFAAEQDTDCQQSKLQLGDNRVADRFSWVVSVMNAVCGSGRNICSASLTASGPF